MLAAALLQRFQKTIRRHDESAIGENWLDKYRRHLLGRTGCLELIVEQGEHIVGREFRPVGVRIGQQNQAGARQAVGHGGMAGYAHGASEAAVIGADKGDKAAASGGGGGNAHGGIIGIRARVAEPDAALACARRCRQQALGKCCRRLIRDHQEAGAGHVACRFGDGVDHCRMAITEAGGGRRGGEVKHPPSVFLEQIGAAAAGCRKRVETQCLNLRNGIGVARSQGIAIDTDRVFLPLVPNIPGYLMPRCLASAMIAFSSVSTQVSSSSRLAI